MNEERSSPLQAVVQGRTDRTGLEACSFRVGVDLGKTCPACGGSASFTVRFGSGYNHTESCGECNGTGLGEKALQRPDGQDIDRRP